MPGAARLGHDHDGPMAETLAAGVREIPAWVVNNTLFVDWLQQHSHYAPLLQWWGVRLRP